MPQTSTIYLANNRSISIASFARWLLLLSCLLWLNLATAAATLEVSSGWVRATPPGVRNAAAFLTLHNHTDQPQTLIAVECATTIAAHCEIHEHSHGPTGMRMQRVDTLAVPAGSSIDFAPGGYHIMLLELAAPLAAGAMVELTLHFADQTRLQATLPVKSVHEE